MSHITLKLKRLKGDETAESVLHKHTVQQNSCTKTAYQFSKKNDLHLSATEMLNSKSDIQILISGRNNICELNYWLKQGALYRAAEQISADDARRKKDEKDKESLNKELERLTKKKEKIESQFNKLKDEIKEAREKLAHETNRKKAESLKRKISKKLNKLSKNRYQSKIDSLNEEISKIISKLNKIKEREERNYTDIFGTKDLFLKRCAKQITRDEFIEARLAPLWSIGDKEHGNRLFNITPEGVIYKPTKGEKYFFPFDMSKMLEPQKKELERLIKCLAERLCSADVKIDGEYIYIGAEVETIYKQQIDSYKHVTNRYASVDANPEFYGFAINDWVSSGRYDIQYTNTYILEPLFDEWFQLNKDGNVASDDPRRLRILNKIHFETRQIAISIAQTCEHYRVQTMVVENLSIDSEDIGNHVSNTKCINLWRRNLFFETLEKQCVKRGIKFLKVTPDYSSFVGNFIFRKHRLEPDMNMAALEIGRRGFEYTTQHVFKTRPLKKNIVFPEQTLFKESIDISMEEIGKSDMQFGNWKAMFIKITKSGTMYRRGIGDIQSPSSVALRPFRSKQSGCLERPLIYDRNMPVTPTGE